MDAQLAECMQELSRTSVLTEEPDAHTCRLLDLLESYKRVPEAIAACAEAVKDLSMRQFIAQLGSTARRTLAESRAAGNDRATYQVAYVAISVSTHEPRTERRFISFAHIGDALMFYLKWFTVQARTNPMHITCLTEWGPARGSGTMRKWILDIDASAAALHAFGLAAGASVCTREVSACAFMSSSTVGWHACVS